MSHSGGSGGQSGNHPGQMGSDFSSADILGSDMENISWSTLFDGLKINTGVRFVIVFTAFVGWLYVIYWIRHHEPFSNQVIGMHAPHSSTTEADRSLIGRIGKVFPFQTSSTIEGTFYTPRPGENVQPQQSYFSPSVYNKSFGEAIHEKVRMTTAAPGQAISSPLVGASEQEFDPRFGHPVRP